MYATVSLHHPCYQRSASASAVDSSVRRPIADAWPSPAVSMLADLSLSEFAGIVSPASYRSPATGSTLCIKPRSQHEDRPILSAAKM